MSVAVVDVVVVTVVTARAVTAEWAMTGDQRRVVVPLATSLHPCKFPKISGRGSANICYSGRSGLGRGAAPPS